MSVFWNDEVFIGQQQTVLSSLQSLIIFLLYLKGLSETDRQLAFQKKKEGKILHMKNNSVWNFSRMQILILRVNEVIVQPENARITQMIYKLHQNPFC